MGHLGTTVQYESEEDRLRDLYPREYTQGWRANDPKANSAWPMCPNPYSGEQAKAYNTGWNDRTCQRDSD